MKHCLVIVLVMLFAVPAFAQRALVERDTDSPIPTVKITSPAFVQMCKDFSDRIGGATALGMVQFKPKVVTMANGSRAGEVWVIQTGNMPDTFEVSSHSLPHELKKLIGKDAQNVLLATCYLRENVFYGTNDVVIIAASQKDAVALVTAIQR